MLIKSSILLNNYVKALVGGQVRDTQSEFIRLYYSFGYYLGLIPYKFVLVEDFDGKVSHQIKGHFLNKVICALVQISWYFNIIGQFRKSLDPVPAPGAAETLSYYFNLAFRIFSIGYYTSFFDIFWRKGENVRDLLDILRTRPSKLETKYISVKLHATLLCSLFTFLTFMSILIRQEIIPPDFHGTNGFVRTYAAIGKFFFFASSKYKATDVPEELDFSAWFFAILYVVVRYLSFLIGFFSDFSILTFVLTFQSISIKLYEEIKTADETKESLESMLGKYDNVKSTVGKINGVIGFAYSFGLLMTYPSNILYFADIYLTDDSWFLIFSNIFFAMNYLYVLAIAAGSLEKVGRIKAFIRKEENRSKMTDVDFIVISDELRNFPCGIQGRGLAVVTHRYVRNILTNFLQYTLLLIVFQYSRSMSEIDCGGSCKT